MFNLQYLRIDLEEVTHQVPKNTIGIDVGQTLTKFAYVQGNELMLLMKPTTNDTECFLKESNILEKKINALHFTGGKAYNIHKDCKKGLNTTILDEFEATLNGINFLYTLKKKRDPSRILVVTIGTGTSIVLKDTTIEHVGGTAMGGGMFMALMRLLYNLDDYTTIMSLASKGNRYNVDLKVSDIYAETDPRIKDYFRAFTASSLGKINISLNLKELRKEDIIHSILGIIGENIGLIATLFAERHDVSKIIFCGGLLIDNKILKNLLNLMVKSRNKQAIFLKNSEFAGAIGALLG